MASKEYKFSKSIPIDEANIIAEVSYTIEACEKNTPKELIIHHQVEYPHIIWRGASEAAQIDSKNLSDLLGKRIKTHFPDINEVFRNRHGASRNDETNTTAADIKIELNGRKPAEVNTAINEVLQGLGYEAQQVIKSAALEEHAAFRSDVKTVLKKRFPGATAITLDYAVNDIVEAAIENPITGKGRQ